MRHVHCEDWKGRFKLVFGFSIFLFLGNVFSSHDYIISYFVIVAVATVEALGFWLVSSYVYPGNRSLSPSSDIIAYALNVVVMTIT